MQSDYDIDPRLNSKLVVEEDQKKKNQDQSENFAKKKSSKELYTMQ